MLISAGFELFPPNNMVIMLLARLFHLKVMLKNHAALK